MTSQKRGDTKDLQEKTIGSVERRSDHARVRQEKWRNTRKIGHIRLSKVMGDATKRRGGKQFGRRGSDTDQKAEKVRGEGLKEAESRSATSEGKGVHACQEKCILGDGAAVMY